MEIYENEWNHPALQHPHVPRPILRISNQSNERVRNWFRKLLTTKSSEIFKKDLTDHKAHYDNIPFTEMIELEKKENPSIWNSVEPDVQEEIIYLAANLDNVFR